MYRVLCPACREGSSASRAGPQRGGERQLSLASLSVRPGAPCTSVQAGSSCIKKHAARRARARGGGQAAERRGRSLPPHSPATMQLSTLLLALLPALAAASPTLDKYRALSKKSGGLLSLSTQQFDELTGPQRDYSLTVVLTALGAQYKCQPCQCVLSPPRPAMGERSLTLISPLAGSSSPSTRRSPSSGTAPARVTTRTISSPTSTLPTGPRSSSECVPPLAPPRSSRAEQS